MRTLQEIKSQIKGKEKERRSLVTKGSLSRDAEEIRKITEQITQIDNDLDELRSELEEYENAMPVSVDTPVPTNAASHGYSTVFSTENERASGVDSFALRSGETLVSRMPESAKKQLDLGKFVRGAVTANWTDAQEERDAFSTSSVGVVIPQILSARVIDLARNVSLFGAAGVPVVPMETNNLTIARVASDPVFGFKEELAEASESTFTLDSLELKAKTAYGFAYVSREAILSARNLTDILNKVFAQAFADMIDKAMLYGQLNSGSLVDYAPSGIFNDPSINVIPAGPSYHYYLPFVKAIGAVKRNNGLPTVVGINAATETALNCVLDNDDNFMEPPKAFTELTKIVSNQLAEDETTGSDAIVFDPKAMVIGLQNNLTLKMFEDSDYCIKHNAVGFQIYAMLDCLAVQPKHITRITGLPTAESSEASTSDEGSDDQDGE